MSDNTNPPKTLERLETEIIDLKIRVRRLESFIQSIPNSDDFLEFPVLGENAEDETLIEQATDICRQYDRASASLLQRRLSIGYARAEKLMDILEAKNVVGPSDGSSKPREVLK